MSFLERIGNLRIVPVVVLEREELAEPLAECLLHAGLDVMEITFRTTAAAEAIRRISVASLCSWPPPPPITSMVARSP